VLRAYYQTITFIHTPILEFSALAICGYPEFYI